MSISKQVTQPLLRMQCTHGNYTVRGFLEKHTCCVVVNVIKYCSYNLPSNPQKSEKTDSSNVSGKRIIALEEVDRKEKEEMNLSISRT